MEVMIKGTFGEIKEVLQAIASSPEQEQKEIIIIFDGNEVGLAALQK